MRRVGGRKQAPPRGQRAAGAAGCGLHPPDRTLMPHVSAICLQRFRSFTPAKKMSSGGRKLAGVGGLRGGAVASAKVVAWAGGRWLASPAPGRQAAGPSFPRP